MNWCICKLWANLYVKLKLSSCQPLRHYVKHSPRANETFSKLLSLYIQSRARHAWGSHAPPKAALGWVAPQAPKKAVCSKWKDPGQPEIFVRLKKATFCQRGLVADLSAWESCSPAPCSHHTSPQQMLLEHVYIIHKMNYENHKHKALSFLKWRLSWGPSCKFSITQLRPLKFWPLPLAVLGGLPQPSCLLGCSQALCGSSCCIAFSSHPQVPSSDTSQTCRLSFWMALPSFHSCPLQHLPGFLLWLLQSFWATAAKSCSLCPCCSPPPSCPSEITRSISLQALS